MKRASWLSVQRVDDNDVGRQLGFLGFGAWALLGLYIVVVLALAGLFGGPGTWTPLGAVAVAVLLLAAALLASPSVTPLPRWRTAVVVLAVLAVVAVITWQQPFHDHQPYYVAWELGCGNFLLFGLALRQRVAVAWLGEIGMIGLVCLWSTLVTGGPLYGLGYSYGQAISLIAGTIFAVALHRAAQRIIDFRAAERQRAAAEARESADGAARETELQLVRELAEPMLRQIVGGEEPDRASALSLEAALRDLIRGRSLAIEPLAGALHRARQRGIDVLLLDDLPDASLPPEELRRAVAWCATRLNGVKSGPVTIRLAASAAGPIVSVVDGSGRRQERELSASSARSAPPTP